jgi:hypothetical protein
MSCPEIYHVGVSTVCLFYLAVCDRLKQSLISVGRLTSEKETTVTITMNAFWFDDV